MQAKNILELIERFEDDYCGPLEDQEHSVLNYGVFPEGIALNRADPDDRGTFITLGASLATNRTAQRLWDNVVELHDREPDVFDVNADVGEDEISELTNDIGFRYPNKDAGVLTVNRRGIRDYNGVDAMLETADYGADMLLGLVRTNDQFTHLGGQKVGPFWCRLIHEHIHELEGLHELPIPVDTHVRDLTSRLKPDVDLDDERIREYWSWLADEHGDSALAIDRYLWLIGTQWDDGGEEYWNEATESVAT